jgi:DNA-binding Lrp family transcriptional regulator
MEMGDRIPSAEDRPPLSRTNERADPLLVCEAKASASKRDQRERSEPSTLREQLKIKVTAMVTAIVFVKAEVARIPEVAEEIAALNGVSEVYSVTGTIDLIAMIRVSNHDQVAEVVADRLNKVPGVVSTETHIAFRAYSAHDLEAAFSLGG